MNLIYRTIVIGVSFLEIWTVSAQDAVRRAVRDDRKSMMMESVKPSMKINDPKISKTTISIDNTPDLHIKLSKRDGGASFGEIAYIDTILSKVSDKELFIVEPGTEVRAVMIGGKMRLIPVKDSDRLLDLLSQRDQLEGPMVRQEIGGLNLSGWKKKKTSEKAKKILKEEFGVVVKD